MENKNKKSWEKENKKKKTPFSSSAQGNWIIALKKYNSNCILLMFYINKWYNIVSHPVENWRWKTGTWRPTWRVPRRRRRSPMWAPAGKWVPRCYEGHASCCGTDYCGGFAAWFVSDGPSPPKTWTGSTQIWCRSMPQRLRRMLCHSSANNWKKEI